MNKSRESGTADKSRESGTADKSRESGTADTSRESGTADKSASKLKIALASLAISFVVLAVVLATLPAHLVWKQFVQPKLDAQGAQIELRGIQGRAWNGTAEQLIVREQLVGKLEWRLRPLSLLSSPQVELSLIGPGLQFKTELISTKSLTEFKNLQAQADASLLSPALGIPAVSPSGTLHAQISTLVLNEHGLPHSAAGSVEWRGAGVSGLANAQFGNYQLVLLPMLAAGSGASVPGIQAEVRDLDGEAPPLSLQGNFQLQGAQYRAAIKLRPNPQHPAFSPSIAQALSFIGQPSTEPNSEGVRLLEINGQLLIGPQHAAPHADN